MRDRRHRCSASHRLLAVSLLVLLGTACTEGRTADDYVASGNEYFDAERYNEAIIEFRNAVRADPDHRTARRYLARAYMRAGRSVEAVGPMIRAADLVPDDLDYQIEVASLLLLSASEESLASQGVNHRGPRQRERGPEVLRTAR